MSDNLTYSLNNSEIDDDDIMVYGKDTQVLGQGDNLIASERTITLNNIDSSKYNPLESGSLFFGTSWYNNPASIYNEDTNIYEWEGRIKKISFGDADNKLKVLTKNFVQDMIEKICVYDNTSGADETPAEVVTNLLSDNLEVPDANINTSSFQNASSIQDNESVYLKAKFTKEDGKTIFNVITEICRISVMDISVSRNIFYLDQYSDWDGLIGREIEKPLADSFKFWTDDELLVNDYSIVYDDDGTNVAYSTGEDTASQSLYDNETSFLAPNQNIDSGLTADHKIYYKDDTGGSWAGDLILSRYKYLKYLCSFNLDYSDSNYDDLLVGDQLDLSFDNFVREPARINSITKDKDNPIINVVVEFLNLPVNVYSRDETAPFPVILETVFPGYEQVSLKFSISEEADHLGYLIYFTTTPGSWEQEYCNFGESPIDVKSPDTTIDGYNFVTLNELNSGTLYYFKVVSYDTSFNKSDDSNILSISPSSVFPNYFYLQGNEYTGLTLDSTNAKDGDQIEDLSEFGTAEFGTAEFTYTAHFDSLPFYDPEGFNYITFRGVGDANDIKYQIRYSNDGSVWEDWSTGLNAIGDLSASLDNSYPYFQIRFIFYSENWSDTDTIFIKGII